MFSITIEGQTADEVRDKVLGLAALLRGVDEPRVETVGGKVPEVVETPVAETANRAPEKAHEAAAPAPPPPPAAPAPADPSFVPGKAIEADKLRAKLRATLAPLMGDVERAKAVRGLLANYGGQVSAVPIDKLEEAIAAAEKL